MSSLTDFMASEGMEVTQHTDTQTDAPPTLTNYVTTHARGCLHWHTQNGDHYADVMQTNLLLANTAEHDRPEDPNAIRGGQLIQPMPQPAQLFGAQHDMVPRANAVPDADMTMIALIEFHDNARWCCLCQDLHDVLTGKQQTAPLAPMSDTEFAEVF